MTCPTDGMIKKDLDNLWLATKKISDLIRKKKKPKWKKMYKLCKKQHILIVDLCNAVSTYIVYHN